MDQLDTRTATKQSVLQNDRMNDLQRTNIPTIGTNKFITSSNINSNNIQQVPGGGAHPFGTLLLQDATATPNYTFKNIPIEGSSCQKYFLLPRKNPNHQKVPETSPSKPSDEVLQRSSTPHTIVIQKDPLAASSSSPGTIVLQKGTSLGAQKTSLPGTTLNNVSSKPHVIIQQKDPLSPTPAVPGTLMFQNGTVLSTTYFPQQTVLPSTAPSSRPYAMVQQKNPSPSVPSTIVIQSGTTLGAASFPQQNLLSGTTLKTASSTRHAIVQQKDLLSTTPAVPGTIVLQNGTVLGTVPYSQPTFLPGTNVNTPSSRPLAQQKDPLSTSSLTPGTIVMQKGTASFPQPILVSGTTLNTASSRSHVTAQQKRSLSASSLAPGTTVLQKSKALNTVSFPQQALVPGATSFDLRTSFLNNGGRLSTPTYPQQGTTLNVSSSKSHTLPQKDPLYPSSSRLMQKGTTGTNVLPSSGLGAIPSASNQESNIPRYGKELMLFREKDALQPPNSLPVDDDYVKCPRCEKKYYTMEEYEKHVSQEHLNSNGPFCEACSLGFESFYELSVHSKSAHSAGSDFFKCCLCEHFDDRSQQRLAQHMSRTHEKTVYNCSTCKKRFTTIQWFNAHWIFHVDKKFNMCRQCNRQFMSKETLEAHKRTQHHITPAEFRTRIECEKCHVTFATKNCKDRHTHDEKVPCEVCGKRLVAKYMRVHLRVHTGKKPYKCPHCDKRFSQRSPVIMHIR
ncbi:unnamed protein product [Callosobruchus maculatus]|uniref:C2H2-type domain-containing protein n=1 Tax=Callosobruchus maculatus TaxID=64391 RepID=A0A653DJX1_CALMS|nr:unnamed protein product [Callosobruchus maculatus]